MPQARPPFITSRNLSTGTHILIIVSVLLIIAGSGVLFYTTVSDQIATDQAHATATAQTNATTLARVITNTASAELNATMTAQTHGTATALASETVVAQAHATATAQANANVTATAQAVVRDPYPPYGGTLVLNDPLNDNSQGYNWDEYALSGTKDCRFVAGAYESTIHDSSGTEGSKACFAENTK